MDHTLLLALLYYAAGVITCLAAFAVMLVWIVLGAIKNDPSLIDRKIGNG